MQKELNLDQAIAEISRRLKRHMGSNGTAHLPVSKDFAGFMTPELLSEVSTMWPKSKELFDRRKFTKDGTDIVSLEPGFYEGAKFINHPLQPTVPTTWISNVDVIAGDDGRKQIKVVDNISGRCWERTIHSGGDPASGTQGWVRVYHEQTLWQGNSKLTDPVTLALPIKDSAGNSRYDIIKVVYQTDFLNYGWAVGNLNGVTINTSNTNNENNIASFNVPEAQMDFPTATTAKLSRNQSIAIYKSEGADTVARMTVEDAVINIREIIGVI